MAHKTALHLHLVRLRIYFNPLSLRLGCLVAPPEIECLLMPECVLCLRPQMNQLFPGFVEKEKEVEVEVGEELGMVVVMVVDGASREF